MNGISHLTFIVRDLDRMATLLCKGLGAREVYDSADTVSYTHLDVYKRKALGSQVR